MTEGGEQVKARKIEAMHAMYGVEPGEKCPVTGVDFGINGLYEMGETKCTGFKKGEDE